MDHVIDRIGAKPAADARAKAPLRSIARTGVLLMAAAVASVFWIDLLGGTAADGEHTVRSYVPASDRWIELGVPPRSEAPLPDRLHQAAIDPIAAPRTTRRAKQRGPTPRRRAGDSHSGLAPGV